jgi:hypothetical protein
MQRTFNKALRKPYFRNGSLGVDIATIANDPYWASVTTLLPMDTNFADLSLSNLTYTAAGGAIVTAVNPKFGAGSGEFVTANARIASANTSSLGFGTNDFTMEMWVYKTGIGSYDALFELNQYNTGILFRIGSASDNLYIVNSSYNWNPSTNFPLNQWNHLALVRSGNTFTVFVNGVSKLAATNSSNLGASAILTIGTAAHSTTQILNGKVDDVRVTKGIARYTADFTLPNVAFPTF